MKASKVLFIFIFLAASAYISTLAYGAIEPQDAGPGIAQKFEQLAKGGGGGGHGGGNGRGRGRGGDSFEDRDRSRSEDERSFRLDDDLRFDDGEHGRRNRGRHDGFDDFGFDDSGHGRGRR